jgi:hypothetical protein
MVVSVRVRPPPLSAQLAASTTGLAANTSAPASANVRDRLEFLATQSALLLRAARLPNNNATTIPLPPPGGEGGVFNASAVAAQLAGLFAGVAAAIADATGADAGGLLSDLAGGGFGVDPELRVGAPLASPAAAPMPLPAPGTTGAPSWLGVGAIAGLVVSSALLTGLCLLAVAIRRHVLKNRDADEDAAEAAPAAPLSAV